MTRGLFNALKSNNITGIVVEFKRYIPSADKYNTLTGVIYGYGEDALKEEVMIRFANSTIGIHYDYVAAL